MEFNTGGVILNNLFSQNHWMNHQVTTEPVVAAAADGSQDLTRRLTWGALSAKLNEATTLMPHISRTKRTDNMNFSTRIQKNILSQHAKSWYSRENIVLLGVVLTCHLGTCIPAKKRMPNYAPRSVIHSVFNINEFCENIVKIQVFV